LKDDGAHLAASKRGINSSSLLNSSSPDIDLGDHLLSMSGFILYSECLTPSSSFLITRFDN
jgi:hypothetical protein